MRIALVDGNKKHKVYPLGLLKIGNYLKSIGHEVKLFNDIPQEHYNEIWISAIFTYHTKYVNKLIRIAKLFSDKVYVGGISPTLMPQNFEIADVVHEGLYKPAEKFTPDYTLLNHIPEYSITRTSKGCIRNCKFCAVKTLEPQFIENDNWINDIHPLAKKLLIYDNNWTAKSFDAQKNDIAILEQQKQIKQIDFCQALDCRLFNDDIAHLLSKIPVKPLRFAFDGMHEDKYFQNAVRIAVKHKLKYISAYVLFNFTDTIPDLYYRLKQFAILQDELDTPGLTIYAYPMCYNPIYDIHSNNYVGIHWTLQEKTMFKRICSAVSFGGNLWWYKKNFNSSVHKFELFLGKNAVEFQKMLNDVNSAKRLRSLLKTLKAERNDKK